MKEKLKCSLLALVLLAIRVGLYMLCQHLNLQFATHNSQLIK